MPIRLAERAQERATQLLERAAQLRIAGRLTQAERAVARAIALLKESDVEGEPLITALLWDASLAEERGRFDAAQSIYAEALRQLGPTARREDESRVLMRLHTLSGSARSARELGQLTASSPLCARALRLSRARLGDRHAMTAHMLIETGVLRKAQGRYDEALRCYREALPIVLRKDGANSHDTATLYHNLGGIEHSRENFPSAETWARKSVNIRRALVGANDVSVAADEAALAAILQARDKFPEALALYRHSRAVFRRKEGSMSREVAYNLANTAALLQRWGRARDAERHYRKALPLLRKSLGPHHGQVALTLNNYGVLLSSMGRAQAGVQHVQQACAIAAATLPARHPQRKLYEYNQGRLSKLT